MNLTIKKVAKLMRRGVAGHYLDGGTGVRGLYLIVGSITRMSPAGDRQPSCSRRTRRGGSRRISRSCRLLRKP
jgi:hypothetical protein